MKHHPLLARLRAVREGGPLIEKLLKRDQPATLTAAYAIAAELISGQGIAGYKIGATSARGRQILRLKSPFYGRILADTLHRSPATVRLGRRSFAVEAEIGCELGTALPPRDTAYARGEVAAAVRKVVPLIELNAPSFAQPFEVGGRSLIADNGVNCGAIIGSPGSMDLYTIQDAVVTMTMNGSRVARGTPPVAPDDPLSSMTWLANVLSRQGVGLEDGQVIATGTMTAPLDVSTDCMLEADFGVLGRVQVNFLR